MDRVTLAYAHSMEVATGWHQSMAALWRWDTAHEGHVYRHGAEISVPVSTSAGIAAARNQAVRDFLGIREPPQDWLFWIDTDMAFPGDAVDRLLEAAHPWERPVMGALCFAQKTPERNGLNGWHSFAAPTIYDWDGAEKRFSTRWEYEEDAVIRCGGTGSACILIHRAVLMRMAHFHGPAWYDPITLGGVTFGEDLSFCLRVAALDIPVHVHTGVRTAHLKPVWLDEPRYRLERAGTGAEVPG
jgi:hypothetical protein